MRVIDQARLWFREGTSDKVYEVDLVEVAAGQYVVNFRFGRRGRALKDGTKTSLPVSLEKARGIFTKLVGEKLAGGYQHVAAAPAPPPAATPLTPAVAVQHTSETQRLIGHLRQGARAEVPLGPVLWRVTDLDLTEAEPVLLELLGASFKPPFTPNHLQPAQWQHLLVTALVRCGTTAALPALAQVDTARNPPHLRDMARLAVARIAPDRARELARPSLPPALLAAYDRGDTAALARAAEELLAVDPMQARACAVALYLVNDAVARPAVLAIARVARLSNTEASIVRALFRLAETRRDGELYALLARRIDAYGGGTRPLGPRTRQYLRRRVARVLRRLGRAGSPDYVAMASAILLGYSDEDAVPRRRGLFGHQYDAFAPFHAFNQILYTHSPRYAKGHHTRSFWLCSRGWRPDAPAPMQREEAFPALWDRAPDALWALILNGRATPVIELATRALRANQAFTDALRDEQIAHVLASGHPLAQEFAFDIARTRPLPLGQLRFFAFAREVSTTTHYHRFTIPKKTGGERVISAPHRRLKAAQHWILANILAPPAVAEQAHGFVPGRSIVSNAAPHVGAAIVVNVDLKDFFPTVTYRRVKGLFRKIGYSEEVATVLGLLCSQPDITETELDGTRFYVARGPRRLPQGAPTSPAITNALCLRLDHRIAGWARQHGFTYTRYADDLTVSTHDRDAPVGQMLAFLRHITAAEGFHVHPDKVRVVRRGRRQEVTGIVVNERPGVPRDELRRFRALLHHIEKDGPAGKTWGHNQGNVLEAALGFASYVAMVDPAAGDALRAKVLALRAKYPGDSG